MEVGTIVLLSDATTGFSSRDEIRPCVVIAAVSGSVRVAAISQKRTDGLALPATPSNRAVGFILRPTTLISYSDAIAAPVVDSLTSRDVDQVLSFIEEELP
jgi:hypothetical protein